jgi:glycosyltransferase involved in cell wall biosynthesis
LNIEWGADPAKTEVLYPGFPTPEGVERDEHEAFRFLFVGTDFERKGGFEVVEAFSEVATHVPTVHLTMVSPDPREVNPDRRFHGWVEPRRQSRVLATFDELRCAGRLAHHQLLERKRLFRDHYAQADAFVMPTHAEGLGFTNIEAMGFGLPIISSTVGPIPEVVHDGVTGLLVAPGDVRALTDAMLRLAANPSSARQIGNAGRREFLERFTLERFRAALGGVYERALSG